MEYDSVRQAGTKLEESLKPIERARNVIAELRKNFENIASLEGSLTEQYFDGVLHIAVKLNVLRRGQEPALAWSYWGCDINAAKRDRAAKGVSGSDALMGFNVDAEVSGDQQFMFVSDVEPMKIVKPEFASLKGLYLIQDEVDDIVFRKGIRGLSFDGTFKRFPIFPKMEPCEISDLAAIGLDENAVCVIECCPEVVDGIADDCRNVLRHLDTESSGLVAARTAVFLGPHSFHAAINIGLEDRFEVLDVTIGPFYLQFGTVEIESDQEWKTPKKTTKKSSTRH